MTGAWPKLFALCIRGLGLMCHMLHACYRRILLFLSGSWRARARARVSTCTYTHLHEDARRRRVGKRRDDERRISCRDCSCMSASWDMCVCVCVQVNCTRVVSSPVRVSAACVCARVCVGACTKESGERRSTEFDRDVPRHDETWGNSASVAPDRYQL